MPFLRTEDSARVRGSVGGKQKGGQEGFSSERNSHVYKQRRPTLSELGAELVGNVHGVGHERLSLVGGVAKHDTLVTGTVILVLLLAHAVHSLADVRGLCLDGDDDVGGLVVKALVGVVVADLLDRVTDNLLVVDLGRGGDLTEDHDHAGLASSLASNLGVGVLVEARVEDGVADLVGELVGVALIDGLGSEKVALGDRHDNFEGSLQRERLRLFFELELMFKCVTASGRGRERSTFGRPRGSGFVWVEEDSPAVVRLCAASGEALATLCRTGRIVVIPSLPTPYQHVRVFSKEGKGATKGLNGSG